MEFLVEFELQVPAGTPQSEVRDRETAESAAAAKLADEGHLVRLWKRPRVTDGATAIGLYRADSAAHLDALLSDLPLADWLHVTVTPLESHPNDPSGGLSMGNRLPDPRLTRVFRLEATLGEPLDLGDTARGRRRIVSLAGARSPVPSSTGIWSGARVPTGRSSWPTAPRSATSATRCRPTPAL